MSRIGKGRALNAARKVPLSLMNEDSNVDDYMSEAKQFIADCYGSNSLSFSENRKSIWLKRTTTGKLSGKPVTLKSLPPTDTCLELNIKRARYQTLVWNRSLEGGTALDPYQVDLF